MNKYKKKETRRKETNNSKERNATKKKERILHKIRMKKISATEPAG